MELTPQQREAVECTDKEVLAVAAAGSGKTRVLVQRIVHLLLRGASPSDIMVLTFTRKAAGEMLARLEKAMAEVTGGDGRSLLHGLTIGTFHSFALRVIQDNAEAIGYGRRIDIIEPADVDMVLENASTNLGFAKPGPTGKLTWKKGLSFAAVRRALEQVYTSGTNAEDTNVRAIITEYWSTLREMSCLDFGMILLKCHELLGNPEVVARYQSKFKHVLVDELQDTDRVQYDLHKFFAPPATFFGVGDPRQSIYAFRGARPDLMHEEHATAKVIDLPDCFRCADRIIDAANRLIAHGSQQYTSMLGRTGIVGYVGTFTGHTERVAATVRHLHDVEGYGWHQIAVLARTHRALARIEEMCVDIQAPVHRVGKAFDICDTDQFRAVHAILRCVWNPKYRLAIMRLQHFEPFSKADEVALRLAELLSDSMKVYEVLDMLPDFPGSYAVYSWWLERYGSATLREALLDFPQRESQDDLPTTESVTLITAHAAKGLEWPVVIMANMNEGDWPSSQAIRAGDIEEERRLAYVAMTRAKEVCLLHFRQPEHQYQDRDPKPVSRFLVEAGLLEEQPQ